MTNDVTNAIDKNLRTQKEESREWIAATDNRERLFDKRKANVLDPFLKDGAKKKLVPAALRDMGTWHLRQALDESINGRRFPQEQLALAGLHSFWHFQTAHAVMESDDPAGYTFYLESFQQVLVMLALGWSSHATRLAETLFDRWDVQKDEAGQVAWQSLPQYMPWLSIKLYDAWKDSESGLDLEPENKKLEGFADLADNVLNEDSKVFGQALSKAADFHALGSGTDDYDPVKDYYHWFFPIELIAACRIRELRGLEVPFVQHPLFDAAPLCRLQPALAVPNDEFLTKVLKSFADATGKLELRI